MSAHSAAVESVHLGLPGQVEVLVVLVSMLLRSIAGLVLSKLMLSSAPLLALRFLECLAVQMCRLEMRIRLQQKMACISVLRPICYISGQISKLPMA